MDPLSAAGSIIAILQLSSRVLTYLNDVKNSSKDYAACAIEAANVHSLLTTLRFRIEEGPPSSPWAICIRALTIPNGVLDQYKSALEELKSRLEGGKHRIAIVWKFRKEEIASILGRTERLKSLIRIALEMDHLLVNAAPLSR